MIDFWRSYKGWVIIAFVLLLIVLIAREANAQSCPGDYGCAQFYRFDAWSRDGLRGHFVFDPGVQGDITYNAGDFETWTGTEGGCTDCPTGWTCACASGDIDQESTLIYKSNTSLNIDPGAAFSPYAGYTVDIAPNEAFQIDFCYRGGTGTEDLAALVADPTLATTYDFAADDWSGAAVFLTNIGTTWTCATYYLINDATNRPNYLFGFSVTSSDGSAIYVDDYRVQRLNAVNVTGARGNVLSVPVTSDQQWGHSEELLSRTGTGPAYKSGMELDGVNDYISCADATCAMDPVNWAGRGYFSVGCRGISDTIAAGSDYLIDKWDGAGNQRSWFVVRSAANICLYVSDDGINNDSNCVAFLVTDALHSFVSTFDPSGGSGACENNLYYDAYQVDTDATMTECVPFDSTADLQVGALAGASTWSGSILECALWERELSAVEANKYISPYFPGSDYNDGFYVDTCSQAASHATCSTQKCRDGTPNACQAEATGVMACFDEYDEQVDNNSFQSYAGDPSVANFADWNESGNVTAYLADSKHGDVSVRMKGGSLTSECLTISGNPTYITLDAKNLQEGTTIEIWLREYATGFCTNQLALTTIATCTPGGVYDDCGALFNSWNVGTNSCTIQIVDTVDGDVLIDNVSVKEASYHTPFVHCPTGSGSVTFNSRQYELHNPLSDYCESENGYCYASGFCVSTWVYSDWAGNDSVLHRILYVPATAATNNLWSVYKEAANNLIFIVYDGAGASRLYYLAANATNWTAGGWKYVEACSNNSDNVLSAHHYNVSNSTWYNWSTAGGAGTGIQNGQASDLHIGHASNAGYLDGYQSEIHISPYSAIYPNIGFNNGIPPVNHAPY